MLVDIEQVQDFATGETLRRVVADTDARTVITYERGVFVSERVLTDAERASLLPAGLDPMGALVTLLAVREVLPLDEAAAVIGLPAQALVDEALAWGVAANT